MIRSSLFNLISYIVITSIANTALSVHHQIQSDSNWYNFPQMALRYHIYTTVIARGGRSLSKHERLVQRMIPRAPAFPWRREWKQRAHQYTRKRDTHAPLLLLNRLKMWNSHVRSRFMLDICSQLLWGQPSQGFSWARGSKSQSYLKAHEQV